ncbi:NADH oxidase [Alteribacter lacisalsi]|uniref:NADH oxidase n=1 Tax=Alteribacter lacisalsi TaxID=2045244 RepID=A0A2W0H8V0_9BACI|nr:NADH:flavin oxidoreductase/NADH oxidase family protein [Alteribacter lacisalsi]PYZ98283.1 NADH oxidase [Alteribacter lacisalsi]
MLETPIILNKQKIKNRVMKAAMSEALGSREHAPTEKLITLYRTWAHGGAGLLITGNVMVSAKALGEPGNVVVEDERHLDLLKTWASASKENGARCWMQINHPGKQVFKGVVNEAVAPSEVPFSKDLQRFFPKARALTEQEIITIAEKFGETARIARKAGFDGIQIHGAHGYLISQFLSPKHNIRQDQWGGSLENRSRFLFTVLNCVREAAGTDFPVSVKLNAADFLKGGFSMEDSLTVVKKLAGAGVDLVEVSGGTYENPEMTGLSHQSSKREAYFLSFAESVKRELPNLPLAVTGGFRTRAGMEEALSSRAADMIGMARPLAVYPDLPLKLFKRNVDGVTMDRKKTGIPFIDQKAMLELAWYSLQLERIGKGKAALPQMSARKALVKAVIKNGTEVFKKRRS